MSFSASSSTPPVLHPSSQVLSPSHGRSMSSMPRSLTLSALSRLGVLLLCLAMVGCPRRGETTADELTIEDLRRAAADNPTDPSAAFDLAAGELTRDDGDPERQQAAIERALALAPRSASVHLMVALQAHSHGEPARALRAFLDTLKNLRSDGDEVVAEIAAAGVEELAQLAPNFADVAASELAELAPHLPIGARQTITDVQVELAYRAGDAAKVAELALQSGCAPEWSVAGPFGPRDLLSFDDTHAADAVGPMAASYDLGIGRGERPTRTYGTRGCALHLGQGPLPLSGTTYAETFVDIAQTGEYTLRLETPNSVEVKIDGERITRLDHRREPLRRVTFHRARLEAGRHEVQVKVTTRHPNPILMVSILPGAGFANYEPEGDDAWNVFLRGTLRFSRGDAVGAREALRQLGGRNTVTGTLKAAVALADPGITGDMRRDHARMLLRHVREKDDKAWYARLTLAQLQAAEGRDQPAMENLRRDIETFPEIALFRLTLAQLLLNRGWDSRAVEHIEGAIEILPGNCVPLELALAYAKRHDRVAEIDAQLEKVVECDARSSERYQQLVQARRWPEARAELDRLASLEPPQGQARLLASHLDLAEAGGAPEAVTQVLLAMQQDSPRSATVRLNRADHQLAQGNAAGALQVLEEALAEEPASMADLRRIRTALGGGFEFEGYRVDGPELVRGFEASERTYDQPQVLVFDYTVVRVFEDLSSLALTHQIYRLQSEEAVDEQGEFAPPEGAYMLKLRTIKPDGTLLEPDLIEGKDTISLPNLASGDYVESEYVRVLDPPAGLPGGLVGDRFYFASFEVPFDRTELVVILPPGLEATVDPRGPAPETAQRALPSGETEYRWRFDQSAPLVQEPASVAGREFIPSINWGVNANWVGFLGGLRDVLADRDTIDPAAMRTAREITAHAQTDREKAEKLYYWLLENIEHNNDVFGQVAPMLAGRTGNRSRLLHYMLGLLDIQSELILARGFGSDQTQSELADEETYRNLALRVGSDFLQPTARGIPYGYVSPALREQDALVLTSADATAAERIVIPPAPPGSDHRRVEIVADVQADGSAQVEVTETFRGAGAIEWRNDLEGVPEAVLEQRFEEAYVARLFNGATMESLTITGREQPAQPFVLRYVARVSSLARAQGGAMVLPGLFPTSLAQRFASTSSRTTAQVVGPPVNLDVVVRVRTEGGAPSTNLEPLELNGPAGVKFTVRASEQDGYLQIERQLRVPLVRIEPNEYEAFANWCRQVDAAESRETTLR